MQMPPVTRNQSKKSCQKTEPYSKENRPIEKRPALLDLIANHALKTVVSTTKEDVKKATEIIFKNDNIIKTEKESRVTQPESEISKPILTQNPETQSSTQKAPRPSLNSSNDGTLYESAVEEPINSKYSEKSDELFITVIDGTPSPTTHESNQSELYQSAVQEPKWNQEEIFEIDKINWNNFMYVGCYARDIFNYLRQREEKFNVTDYIKNQIEITPRHRAIVVNWLVSLQDIYGLNHEVLYMAVKLIDLYLMKIETAKDKFQLLASSSLLLSSKIDERELGFPYDLVKQCKYIFTEDELFVSERELAKALNYDINVPLSYVFLRRFARCLKCPMILLTLARYILESTLLVYEFVTLKESLKAASALYLAYKMGYNLMNANNFFKYTGYEVKEVKDTVIAFNNMLHNRSSDLTAVYQKYIHETFYRVASKSLISNSRLTFD